jgi:HK97 gp10 family phage protein
MQVTCRVVVNDRHLRQIIADYDIAAEDAEDAAADAIVEKAQQLAPVRTGFLRDSIEKVIVGVHRLITIGAPYWFFVEYGTVNMAAQPYLNPAIEAVDKRAIADVFFKRLGLR